MFASGQFYVQVLNKVIKDAQRKANVHIVLEFDQCNTRFMVQEAIIEREVRPARDFTVRLDERWCDYDKFQKLHMFLLLTRKEILRVALPSLVSTLKWISENLVNQSDILCVASQNTHTKKLPSSLIVKEKIMSKIEGFKYEELRMQRITENQAKIEALGLSKLAIIFKDRIQKAKKKDKKPDDEDYGDLDQILSENYKNDKRDEFAATNDLESRKRKVIKSSILNSKRVYNDSSIHHSLDKEVKESLPNNASHASELTNVEQVESNAEDSISGEWSDVVEVWKATHMSSNGTWCIPKGEEIMEALQNVGDIYQKEISKVPVSLVEHFAMVLGRKSNYSLGVGSAPIEKKFSDKQIIQNQLENAQNRANNLELEVQKLTNITKKQEDVITQLHIEVQFQRELIETNREQMKQNLENEVKCQIVGILEELSTSESPTNLSAQDVRFINECS
ncbi:hypothetical protein JHK82_015939 [Glycine max]|nr:hypothetical protein JHK85_016336 [Glycine max]KAG5046557.1 hypothetical protein JHK86_015963 [Glycine max]KAG5149058.1 hypothetical protein JHK82_015939 [Glycine max]